MEFGRGVMTGMGRESARSSVNMNPWVSHTRSNLVYKPLLLSLRGWESGGGQSVKSSIDQSAKTIIPITSEYQRGNFENQRFCYKFLSHNFVGGEVGWGGWVVGLVWVICGGVGYRLGCLLLGLGLCFLSLCKTYLCHAKAKSEVSTPTLLQQIVSIIF